MGASDGGYIGLTGTGPGLGRTLLHSRMGIGLGL